MRRSGLPRRRRVSERRKITWDLSRWEQNVFTNRCEIFLVIHEQLEIYSVSSAEYILWSVSDIFNDRWAMKNMFSDRCEIYFVIVEQGEMYSVSSELCEIYPVTSDQDILNYMWADIFSEQCERYLVSDTGWNVWSVQDMISATTARWRKLGGK